MQYLDAVNYQLALLGSPPVATVDELHPDVQSAITALTEANKAIQNKSWWFNTDYNVKMTPDATTKEITLGSSVYEVIATSRLGVIQRGTKLYDTYNNTYQFDIPVYINTVNRLDWDLLDESVQDTIKFRAAVHVCENDLEDFTKAETQKEFFQAAIIQMKKTNLKIQRRNIFTTPRVARAMYRVRPYALANGMRNPLYPGG